MTPRPRKATFFGVAGSYDLAPMLLNAVSCGFRNPKNSVEACRRWPQRLLRSPGTCMRLRQSIGAQSRCQKLQHGLFGRDRIVKALVPAVQYLQVRPTCTCLVDQGMRI